MKFGSLFSGIGGFDLGLERAGMECMWQVEYDSHAQKVLESHWPDVPRYKDVNDVGAEQLEPVDLICGGFPCQDLSVAGKRAGLAGGRSGLWWQFHRILSELLPQYVLIENVPGLLSSNKGRDMGILCGSLAQLGYGWAYRVLDAQYFGLAQRRRRVFIVGCLGGWERAAQILFEPESGTRNTPPRRETGQGVAFRPKAGSKAGSTGAGVELSPTLESEHRSNVAVAFQQNTRDEVRQINGDGLIAGALAAQPGMKQQNYIAFDGRNMDDHDVSPTIQAKKSGGYSLNYTPMVFGGNNTSGEIAVSTAINAHPTRRNDFESETFVSVPRHSQSNGLGVYKQDIANTLEAVDSSNQAVINRRVGVRRLTPLECERLQGFPDGWTQGQSDSQRYRQLGNAVAVPVVEWIGRRIPYETE